MKKHIPSLIKQTLIICLTIIFWSNHIQAKHAPKFAPKLTALMVKDLDKSIIWYQQKLGFKIDQPKQAFPSYQMKIAVLKHNGFRLELIEKKGAINIKNLKLASNHYLGGFLKLGFMVDNLKGLYHKLKKQRDVDFITGVGTLPKVNFGLKWPTQFLLIRDIDGNMLQFFSYNLPNRSSLKLTPWLAGITVKDLNTAKEWYQTKLGFTFYNTIGKKGNRRAILAKSNFVIELFEPAQVIFAHDLKGKKEVQGIKKIAFGVDNFSDYLQKFRQEQVKFFYGPVKSKSTWNKQSMIIKDVENNLVQYFELL